MMCDWDNFVFTPAFYVIALKADLSKIKERWDELIHPIIDKEKKICLMAFRVFSLCDESELNQHFGFKVFQAYLHAEAKDETTKKIILLLENKLHSETMQAVFLDSELIKAVFHEYWEIAELFKQEDISNFIKDKKELDDLDYEKILTKWGSWRILEKIKKKKGTLNRYV